jgi:gamma-glutamylcysteine synthetase
MCICWCRADIASGPSAIRRLRSSPHPTISALGAYLVPILRGDDELCARTDTIDEFALNRCQGRALRTGKSSKSLVLALIWQLLSRIVKIVGPGTHTHQRG